MRIETKKIVNFCQEYLNTKDFNDDCHNGLQVEGAEEVDKIITGVSLSQELIKKAIKKKAQMIMVHHGLFKNIFGESLPQIKGYTKNRLKLLLENNINLAGFHLPLDAHPEIGNNISLCEMLGIKNPQKFDVGFIGELGMEVNFDEFVDKVNKALNIKSYVIPAGKDKVKKVGIISGGASPYFEAVFEMGVDTYICGDVREKIVRAVEETSLNFINAGHYNTEKEGIRNLGELVGKEFGVEVEFVDVACEI